jgi:hypothetical protein
MQTTRCPRCGLSQLARDACKACGAPLASSSAAPQTFRAAPVRRAPASPSRLRPYIDIWTRPRETIRAIVNEDPYRAVILLAWLAGIADLLETALGKPISNPNYWPVAILLGVFMGPLMGFARVYVGGGLVAMTGRWLGGEADSEECRTALAWGSVPQAATLAFWAPAVALFGRFLFTDEKSIFDAPPAAMVIVALIAAPWIAALVWAWVLQWKCVGEVHGFSAWRGFFAMCIAKLMIVAVFVGLVLIAVAAGFPPKTNKPSTPAKESPAANGGEREGPALGTVRIEGGRVGIGLDGPAPVAPALVPPRYFLADSRLDAERRGATGRAATAGLEHEAGQLVVEVRARG